MKILIDINHPAHVHYFKNCIKFLKQKGHQIVITARDRYPAQQLLESLNLSFVNRGAGSKTFIGKLFYILLADLKIFRVALKTKPDLFLSFGTPYPNHVAWILRKPSINFQDTDNAGLMYAITIPFATVFCTPQNFKRDYGKKHVRFNSFMELSYLHPKYFTPDDSVFDLLGLSREDKYIILRFVSWTASHDIGHKGISLEKKREAVEKFSSFGRVFISSEEELPDDLKPYQINIPPDRMHDAICFSELLYGESATMASEAAVLGIPAIYVDNDGRNYTDEEEKQYDLIYNFTESVEDQQKSIQKGLELLKISQIKKLWQVKRAKLLKDKIDLTDYMVKLIDQYPNDKIGK